MQEYLRECEMKRNTEKQLQETTSQLTQLQEQLQLTQNQLEKERKEKQQLSENLKNLTNNFTNLEIQHNLCINKDNILERQPLPVLRSLLERHSVSLVSLSQLIGKALEVEKQKNEETFRCKICMEETISVFFQPCSHSVCCSVCASKINICPICRQSITQISPLHFC